MRRLAYLLLLATPALAADPPKPDKDGFVPLFNGKDLSGFVNLNCGPKTWSVKGGELITSGTPYGLLRTDRQYENFEAEFEWMHVNTKEVGNSGFFVWCDALPQKGGPYTRGIEVQVLVNYPKNDWATNHGDVFSVSGAKCKPDRPHPKGYERCLPSEERCKGGGEWNHYRVVAKDGAIKLSVNGKEVSGVSECNPRKGYLAFESEGAECHFRNVRIKELPSSDPKKEQVATEDLGWKPLFNHADLDGWKTEKDAWKVEDGVLKSAGTADLVTESKYQSFELLLDWKPVVNGEPACVVVLGEGGQQLSAFGDKATERWSRLVLQVKGPMPVTFRPKTGVELRNIYLREVTPPK